MRIREIAQARPRFGYVRIWIMLRREGWPDNKKRDSPAVPTGGPAGTDALEALSARRRLPKALTVDHGTEFTSNALDEWAYQRGVALDFIRPGKPVENAFIESFK